jgi:hypothetical protein
MLLLSVIQWQGAGYEAELEEEEEEEIASVPAKQG